jgi:hypothetical protein
MFNKAFLGVLFIYLCSCSNQKKNYIQTTKVLIIQPIVLQSDEGTEPASIKIPEAIVDKAFQKADIDFHFLEPIYYNNTRARDGKINLDEILEAAQIKGLIKGQNDLVNMFFVNAVDGQKGPLGRGMMNGNIVFIALGQKEKQTNEQIINMQAFVIAHEVGHNLGLRHALNDPYVSDSLPNIQGNGAFKDRVNPKFSLNNYQIKEINKSNLVHSRIEFLDKKKASIAILDETYEPYFSKLQVREIEAFVQEKSPKNIDSARAFAREKFSSAVIEFNSKEKQIISYVVNKLNLWLLDNNLNLMGSQPWRFIKIEDWLCGGFAHTRGTFIILSQSYLNRLTKDWSEAMKPESEARLMTALGGLLVHEQMHSLQRTFKSRFDNLYINYWNFIPALVQEEMEINKHQVSNPDAPLAEWIISDPQDSSSFFWVRTLLKKGVEIPVMGKDFIDAVFKIKKTEDIYKVVKTKDGDLLQMSLSEISFYQKSFPIKRGLDHPNELSAYMFSDYFKASYNSKIPFQMVSKEAQKNTDLFVDWVKKKFQ